MFRKLVFSIAMIFVAASSFAQDAEDTIIDNTIRTENYNESVIDQNSDSTTKVISPPPSAISPSINSSNSDLCTVGVSGAVQTQILGISAGKTVRDMNCEKLKNAKTLYDMGMKVAAVSVMCQDPRVFKAMMNAGTPCPYDGLIGEQAREAWKNNVSEQPGNEDKKEPMSNETKSTLWGGGIIGALFLILLL